jgi:hypothetical protein
MPPMVGSAPTCDSAMTNRRQWTCRKFAIVCLTVFGSLGTLCMAVGILTAGPASAPSDEHASWGTDHVGSPLPDYATGDECLFCHRDRFGADWEKNAHERTVRPAESAPTEIAALKASPATSSFSDQVEFVLGDRRQIRFLKRATAYGKLAMLSAKFAAPPPGANSRRVHGKLVDLNQVHWDDQKFARTCAGCHTTGVDPKSHAFAAISLDCFTCHGVVEQKHAQTKMVYLGRGRHDPPHVAIAICGQCHLRNGKSRSTGLPYPTNFVAGDNLFRDFQVSLTDAELAAMNPADRHVAQNVREVLDGKSQTTCVTCHDVHRQTSVKHRQVAEGATCASCHEPGKPKSQWKHFEVHSSLCGY